MSVKTELGIGSDVESIVANAWQGWTARQPQLAAVENPLCLQAWRQNADPQLADEVLHGLAWLASIDGGDDIDAATVLAWLLVPGASFVARRLRTLTEDIDHVVAGELWILVRTFPLRRRNVVVNLMRDLRSRVLEACEAPAALRRTDRTWFATGGSIDTPAVLSLPIESTPTALEELTELLDWAADQQVIRPSDRQLLLCLVQAADEGGSRVGPGLGLLANHATEKVALTLGVSERTVRRRTRVSIQALAAAAPAYRRVA